MPTVDLSNLRTLVDEAHEIEGDKNRDALDRANWWGPRRQWFLEAADELLRLKETP